jgi:hypothetical protein
MLWNLDVGGTVLAWVDMPDDLIEWLVPRMRNARARAIDPYRDTFFDQDLVATWLGELRRIADDMRHTACAECEKVGRWPRNPATRAALLTGAATRALGRDAHWRSVQDAIALLELAQERRGRIDARGD